MIAGLLFLTGFVAVVVTVVMVGYSTPTLIQTFMAGMELADANMFELIGALAVNLTWALGPFVGGLVLMGFARVIMLLGAINRGVGGNA